MQQDMIATSEQGHCYVLANKVRASRIRSSSASNRSCGLALDAAFSGTLTPLTPFACFFGLLTIRSSGEAVLARRFLVGPPAFDDGASPERASSCSSSFAREASKRA